MMDAFSPYMFGFFALIVAFGGFFIVNLFLAVIVNEVIEAQAAEKEEAALQKTRDAAASSLGAAAWRRNLRPDALQHWRRRERAQHRGCWRRRLPPRAHGVHLLVLPPPSRKQGRGGHWPV